ncbi:hypothetical protein GCM10023238_22730 [Streptomyces heliomycini]
MTALLRNDATWRIVPGLADGTCYSFESRNYRAMYLRHRAYRVYKEGGSARPVRADATFCPVRGANGGVRLSPTTSPGSICATTTPMLWLATRRGPRLGQPALFAEDTTWAVEPPGPPDA